MAVILGTTGNDTLNGGSGNDEIFGFGGRDFIDAGGGDDLIDGGVDIGAASMHSSYFAGSGNDTVLAYTSGARLYGEDGDDVLSAFGEGAVLNGGLGNDTLNGADNVEAQQFGFEGVFDFFSETYAAEFGANVISTGTGFDLISLTTGFDDFEVTDIAYGDVFHFYNHDLSSSAFSYDAGTGNLEVDTDGNSVSDRFIDVGTGFAGDVLATEVFEYDGYSPLAFVYFLSAAAVNSTGGSGHDLLAGGAVNDQLSGGGGDDVLKGYLGADTLTGGAGFDTILGGAGDDVIYGYLDAADALIAGGTVRETLHGGAGDDFISASGSAYSNVSGNVSFVTYGGPGNDTLIGSDGWDYIYDVSGSDSIVGGGGIDEYIVGYDLYSADSENDLPVDRLYILDNARLSENGNNTDTLSGVEKVTILDGEGDDILISVSYDPSKVGPLGGGTHVRLSSSSGGKDAGDDFLQNISGAATLTTSDNSADTLLGGENLEHFHLLGDGGDFLSSGAGYDIIRVSAFENISGIPAEEIVIVDFDENDGLYLNRSGVGLANVTITQANGQTSLTFDVNIDGLSDVKLTFLGLYDGDFSFTDGGGLGTRIEFVGDIDRRGFAGGYFADSLIGGENDDTLYGFHDDDTLLGWAGSDTLYGGVGDDLLVGGGGFDSLEAGAGSDRLFGGTEDDVLSGGSDGDTLAGGDGSDTLNGDGGADALYGGAGNDSLNGGADNDLMTGNGDNDLVLGGGGRDTMLGGDGDDTVSGNDGDDQISGTRGSDSVFGGLGADIAVGGDGDDLVDGNEGDDVVGGGLGNDTLYGSDGADTVVGGDGFDQLNGGIDNDALYGGINDDTLNGGSGNDLLAGANDDDQLNGEAGNDSLYGGAGNDTLTGGEGGDSLIGSGGDDLFVFNVGDGADVIGDFTAGAASDDVIELSGFGAAFDDFTDVQAAASDNGVDTTIDLGGGQTITLTGVLVADLHQDDFLFS